MEIDSIVDSRIQGTYLNSSTQKAIEIAMACVSSTAIQRPDITVVFNDLKECLEIEMPSEITKITEAYESDDTISSSGSIIKTCHIRVEMSIWECCELLNEVVDESDPDLDEPQIEHLLQTAEAIRKDYPNEDWLHLTGLIHGFISIDCGLATNSSYTEKETGINYISDESFIETNESKVVILTDQQNKMQPYWSLRVFPQGTRNCYKINVTRGTKYLIRASFLYGNYDDQYRLPEFQLHLGPNLWDSVKFESASTVANKELIHVPLLNYIHVCLVDTNKGVPFISAIELRTLPNTIYQAQEGSLALDSRYDTGQTANLKQLYRYPDDIYDRFWYGYDRDEWTQLNTSSSINTNNTYQPPSVVLATAATPKNVDDSVNIFWLPSDNTAKYYVYMHFAEVEKLPGNESRQFNITRNGELYSGLFAPKYLSVSTIFSLSDWSRGQYITLSIIKAGNSTLPPILNAFETYMVKDFAEPETNQQDETMNFNKNEFLESQGQRFTYSEIVKITNNFASIIGRGGFGKVYLGTLKNETQVAVKLLGSSRQGSNEFRNEKIEIEIESIVDSRIQGTYLNSSAQKSIEIAMACVSSTSIQRPDITVVFNDLKECLEIEMPSEITKITEAYESESDDTISSSGSIIKTSHMIRSETESNTISW
ncbi:hypothetical protein ACE6H2_009946 [Prunus campanulata]